MNGAAPIDRSVVGRREEAARPDDRVAVAESEAEADRPVDERADAEDEHVLAGDVRGVLHPRQARLEEREAGLHEHDEDAATTTQTVFDGDHEVGGLHATSTSSSARPVRLCVTFSIGRRPDDPVARLVAAARGVGDRRDDGLGALVLDDEREQRLRQEPRLEDAPAVLVRDAALAPVADRLDHGHADVAGLVLDGVDHGLDPLADHDCLDFGHADLLASSFEDDDVTPDAVELSEPLPRTRRRGTRTSRAARGSPRFPGRPPSESSRCRRAPCLRSAARAGPGRPLPLCVVVRRRRCARRRRRSRAAAKRRCTAAQPDDRAVLDGHQAMAVEVRARSTSSQDGRLGLEGRVPAGDALLEDRRATAGQSAVGRSSRNFHYASK